MIFNSCELCTGPPPPFPTLSGDQGGLQIIVGTADLEFVQVQVLAGAEKILCFKSDKVSSGRLGKGVYLEIGGEGSVCKVGTVAKISDYQPEGPGFNPRFGQGFNFG